MLSINPRLSPPSLLCHPHLQPQTQPIPADMSTGDPEYYDDGYINDYDTNTSFDQTDMSSLSDRDVEEGEGEDTQHEEYLSYSSMVDVAVKSNGQMLATHNHIVDGIPLTPHLLSLTPINLHLPIFN